MPLIITKLILTCENVSRACQKYWTCLSVSISPTWYIVWSYIRIVTEYDKALYVCARLTKFCLYLEVLEINIGYTTDTQVKVFDGEHFEDLQRDHRGKATANGLHTRLRCQLLQTVASHCLNILFSVEKAKKKKKNSNFSQI